MRDLEADQYRWKRSRINKSPSGSPSGSLPVFFRGRSFQLPGNCFQGHVFLNIRQKHSKNTSKIIDEPGIQRRWSGVSGDNHIHIYTYKTILRMIRRFEGRGGVDL